MSCARWRGGEEDKDGGVDLEPAHDHRQAHDQLGAVVQVGIINGWSEQVKIAADIVQGRDDAAKGTGKGLVSRLINARRTRKTPK